MKAHSETQAILGTCHKTNTTEKNLKKHAKHKAKNTSNTDLTKPRRRGVNPGTVTRTSPNHEEGV